MVLSSSPSTWGNKKKKEKLFTWLTVLEAGSKNSGSPMCVAFCLCHNMLDVITWQVSKQERAHGERGSKRQEGTRLAVL
jgi:hypothetical protein